MKLLVYYNTLHKSFNVIFDYGFRKEIGDIYKGNSILINIIPMKEKTKPLKIVFKKLNTLKEKIGDCFIYIGERMKKLPRKGTSIVYKTRYPWWK